MTDDDYICDATEQGKELFRDLHSRFEDNWDEDFIKETVEDTGLEYLSQGDSRIVFLDREGNYLSHPNACVVKINKYGESASNLNEVNNYTRVAGPPQKHLMTITDWGASYKWLVMPYVSTEVTDEMLMELEETFIKYRLKVHDVNQRNTAKVQDRAVLIDYDTPITELDMNRADEEERLRLMRWKYS